MKSSLPLTAKYRPQLFSEVAGQAATKSILSRAAAEGQVAPAYLFSGTRGVGKTTIARIFAKALNCERGPGPEPCNECESCRQITQGIAVDVQEIDGASNRGIDDAKRLKEDIGYAPLEGRFKIFIIDEAHMLTREAFNALLKTLEEPPARVTFILATTEPHKFPATIISRCQHFIFKQLAPQELKDHLSGVLSRENIGYDDEAVNLLARRAAGSVRDGMSLLGQVLSLGQGQLGVADVQNVLGLAGQDLFLQIVDATARQDPLQVAEVVEALLAQGVDMGFFLRELTLLWRNLFMLRQAGEKAIPLLGFGQEEGALWLATANRLPLAHIHANWQLTLEGQRRVLDSLEPGQALELLLLNIAMLPCLIPVSGLPDSVPVSGPVPEQGVRHPVNMNSGAKPEIASTSPAFNSSSDLADSAQKKTSENATLNSDGALRDNTGKKFAYVQSVEPGSVSEKEPERKPEGEAGPATPANASNDGDWQEAYGEVASGQAYGLAGSELSDADLAFVSDGEFAGPELPDLAGATDSMELPSVHDSSTASRDAASKHNPLNTGETPREPEQTEQLSESEDIFADSLAVMQWENFLEFCQSKRIGKVPMVAGSSGELEMGSESLVSPVFSETDNEALKVLFGDFGIAEQDVKQIRALERDGLEAAGVSLASNAVNPALLNRGRGAMQGGLLVIECPSDTSFEHLCRPEQVDALVQLARAFSGREMKVEILPPEFKAKTRGDLRREAQEHKAVVLLKEKMGAYLLDCVPEHEQN